VAHPLLYKRTLKFAVKSCYTFHSQYGDFGAIFLCATFHPPVFVLWKQGKSGTMAEKASVTCNILFLRPVSLIGERIVIFKPLCAVCQAVFYEEQLIHVLLRR
jgi:hypothetical protein